MKLLLLAMAGLCLFGAGRRWLFWSGAGCGLAYLVLRGVSLGRLPLVGPHDTLAFFAVSLAVLTVPFLRSPLLTERGGFAFGAGLTTALLALLALAFPAFAMPLPPVLQTLWFELHVALAFFAYALFALGALLGGLYLQEAERGLLDLQYRAALVGYSFFSASMVTGGIWGYYAWGSYWLWTPKELWTTVLWLFYSLWLHLRLKGPSWERAIAWGGIVGFGVTLFTYLGVSLLLKSSHSF